MDDFTKVAAILSVFIVPTTSFTTSAYKINLCYSISTHLLKEMIIYYQSKYKLIVIAPYSVKLIILPRFG